MSIREHTTRKRIRVNELTQQCSERVQAHMNLVHAWKDLPQSVSRDVEEAALQRIDRSYALLNSDERKAVGLLNK